MATLLAVMVIFQVASTSNNFAPNKDSRQNKVYFGLLKDLGKSLFLLCKTKLFLM